MKLTNKQAYILYKNIENPKPLNKEIIDRFYVNMLSLSKPPRGESGQVDSRNRPD
jgi:hypothetical protein